MQREPPEEIQEPLHLIKIPIKIRKGHYYYIKNHGLGKYLTVAKSSSQNFEKADITLQKLSSNASTVNQLWMINEVVEDKFEVMHALSGYVLEQDSDLIMLKYPKSKNSQMFYYGVKDSEFEADLFFLKEFKRSKRYVFYENDTLKCEERPLYRQACNLWKLQPVNEHPATTQTCIIEFHHSNHVLDISESSIKEEAKIIQSSVTKSFSQRWYIEPYEEDYFVIRNLKSHHVLEVKDGKKKQGSIIVQNKLKEDAMSQRWTIEEHGKRIYLIRSAMDPELLMTVKDSCLKEGTEVCITKHEALAFWKIFGEFISDSR